MDWTGGCFCYFNNVPQDGNSAGVAEAAHSHHPAPNVGPFPPCLPLATQQQKRKKTIQAGLTRRHPLAARIPAKPRILNKRRVQSHHPHTTVSEEKWGQKGCLPQSVPPCSNARGCGVCGANLACMHHHTPRQTSKYSTSFHQNLSNFLENLLKTFQKFY